MDRERNRESRRKSTKPKGITPEVTTIYLGSARQAIEEAEAMLQRDLAEVMEKVHQGNTDLDTAIGISTHLVVASQAF